MGFRLQGKFKLLVFLLTIVSVKLVAQPRIDLTEGSLFIEGGVNAKYELIIADPLRQSFRLKTDLLGGYFIIDNLSVGLGLQGSWRMDIVDAARLGLKVFSTYYFDTNSTVFPYLGINLIPSWSLHHKEFQLLGGLEMGILVSLSESVAVDFGLRPEIFFKLYDTQTWAFTLPVGFFGIKAVF